MGRFLLLAAALLLLPPSPAAVADDEVPHEEVPHEEVADEKVAEERVADEAAAQAYAEALESARKIESALVRSVEKVRLNSVTVYNLGRKSRDGPIERLGGGSGVIINRKGKLWILTNVHVTARHEGLEVVTHDGVVRVVEQHDAIPQYDIALLRFSEKPKRVKFKGVRVNAKNSKAGSGGLKEGTWVIATGNPFFLAADGNAVATLGVISGLDRVLPGQYSYVGAIQHDAEVNPGNSGGPLWNLDGDLVGINGKIFMGHRVMGVAPTNTGASFSLPIAQVESFLRQLIDEEDAKAGFLGIATETATDAKGKAVGARIVAIHPASPVRKRLSKDSPRTGDVVVGLTVKGRHTRIYKQSDLLEVLSHLAAGTEISLKFKRGKNKYRRWKGDLGDRKR